MQLDERLEHVFRDEFGNPGLVLTDTTTADDVEGWDSLKHISLIFRIEDAFGVRFAEDEIATMANVGELKRLLRRKGCE